MAFPTSISAAKFSSIVIASAAVPATLNEANLKALFATTGDYDEIKNIRDMPDFGTPANIVKVPVYGQGQTQSIGAQSDAPDLELMINLIEGDWAEGTVLGDYVNDGLPKVFQVAFLDDKAPNFTATAGGLGAVPNSIIYFVGKIESLLATPARDDSKTAKVALSIQSDFYGFYTQD